MVQPFSPWSPESGHAPRPVLQVKNGDAPSTPRTHHAPIVCPPVPGGVASRMARHVCHPKPISSLGGTNHVLRGTAVDSTSDPRRILRGTHTGKGARGTLVSVARWSRSVADLASTRHRCGCFPGSPYFTQVLPYEPRIDVSVGS